MPGTREEAALLNAETTRCGSLKSQGQPDSRRRGCCSQAAAGVPCCTCRVSLSVSRHRVTRGGLAELHTLICPRGCFPHSMASSLRDGASVTQGSVPKLQQRCSCSRGRHRVQNEGEKRRRAFTRPARGPTEWCPLGCSDSNNDRNKIPAPRRFVAHGKQAEEQAGLVHDKEGDRRTCTGTQEIPSLLTRGAIGGLPEEARLGLHLKNKRRLGRQRSRRGYARQLVCSAQRAQVSQVPPGDPGCFRCQEPQRGGHQLGRS